MNNKQIMLKELSIIGTFLYGQTDIVEESWKKEYDEAIGHYQDLKERIEKMEV